MKRTLHLLTISATLLLFTITSVAQNSTGSLPSALPAHPRILLLSGEENLIQKTIAADSVWNATHLFILSECDKLLKVQPVERILIGRRLLDKSREALRRIFFLSYAWRITSDARYLERAEKEMLAVSAFTDWNPSHFLDVAEMTMAVSIGYDWLYNGLSAESRNTIRKAIIEKGLNPSFESANNSWVKASHNWNQVCNAGMTYGALAVYDEQPELAKRIINRAITSIKLPMDDYMPDGAYPEGYGYWGYGTSFNIMFLSAIEKAFGKGTGPEINTGFFKTASYLENMTGPTGNAFNYSDAGSGGGLQPAMFWFGNRLENPSLLWSEKYHLLNRKPDNDRLLPAVMIWSAGMTMEKIVPPASLIWTGQGKSPVALMRSSWTDKNAVFVGLKAGSPSVNHGHMDIGSFIMESDGVRWAMDFGMQDYNSLETAGVKLWGLAQNSERWDVYRYNNLAHSTLTINGQLQKVEGYASINSFSTVPEMLNAVTDLSEVYKGNLKKAVRGIAIVDKKYVAVRDEIQTADTEVVVRWTMATPAEVKITGPTTATLSKNGKKLTLKIQAPANASLVTWSTEPTHSYDAKNPGTILVGFEVRVPANSKIALMVSLLPEGTTENNSLSRKNLENWPKFSPDK
jgi:hypothetical protein